MFLIDYSTLSELSGSVWRLLKYNSGATDELPVAEEAVRTYGGKVFSCLRSVHLTNSTQNTFHHHFLTFATSSSSSLSVGLMYSLSVRERDNLIGSLQVLCAYSRVLLSNVYLDHT